MSRAQGSLEYLIIIAAVLAIAATTVLFLSGVLKGQTPSISIAACKQTSETCELSKLSSPNAPCDICVPNCVNTSAVNPCSTPEAAKGVSKGAINCCKKGESDRISSGSTGCGTVLHMVTGFNDFDVPDDWEVVKPSTFCSTYPIGKTSYQDSAGEFHSFVCSFSTPYSPNDFDICPGLHIWIVAQTAFDING